MIRMLEKLSFIVFLLYLTWFKEAFYTIDLIQYVSIVLLTGLVITDALINNATFKNNSFTNAFGMFAIFVFFSGILIVKNQDVFFSYLIRYTVFFVLCLDCIYIYHQEKSMQWLFQIFIICALICSIQAIFFGASYNNGILVTTMSRHNNPNKLGLVMIIGVFSLLQDYDKFNKHLIADFIILATFSYTIILTASRKMFISLIVLIMVWTFRFFKMEISGKLTRKKLFGLFLLIGSGALIVYYFVNKYSDTALFARMGALQTGSNSFDSRTFMYKEAVEFWLSHPIWGIGFAQFGEYTSTHYVYSHSTYAEILSCTGIVGSLLVFIPILLELKKVVLLLRNTYNKENSDFIYKCFMLLTFFLVELFIGSAQILIYEIEHMLSLTILFSIIDDEFNNRLQNMEREKKDEVTNRSRCCSYEFK